MITLYNNSLITYFTVANKKKSDFDTVKLDRHFMRELFCPLIFTICL